MNKSDLPMILYIGETLNRNTINFIEKYQGYFIAAKKYSDSSTIYWVFDPKGDYHYRMVNQSGTLKSAKRWIDNRV